MILRKIWRNKESFVRTHQYIKDMEKYEEKYTYTDKVIEEYTKNIYILKEVYRGEYKLNVIHEQSRMTLTLKDRHGEIFEKIYGVRHEENI